jgi:hypothetical protein
LGEAAHVRAKGLDFTLLSNGVRAFTLEDLFEALGLKRLLNHARFYFTEFRAELPHGELGNIIQNLGAC